MRNSRCISCRYLKPWNYPLYPNHPNALGACVYSASEISRGEIGPCARGGRGRWPFKIAPLVPAIAIDAQCIGPCIRAADGPCPRYASRLSADHRYLGGNLLATGHRLFRCPICLDRPICALGGGIYTPQLQTCLRRHSMKPTASIDFQKDYSKKYRYFLQILSTGKEIIHIHSSELPLTGNVVIGPRADVSLHQIHLWK